MREGDGVELLSTHQMTEVDRLMAERGVPGAILMDRAGAAVAAECVAMVAGPDAGILVLCGPGNNGGDGIVAACRLRANGFAVRLALLGDVSALSSDAAAAMRGWPGPVEDAATPSFEGVDLIVDALFGAGLSRPIEGSAADLIERVNVAGLPVLAVDVPSGLDGTTGLASGPVVRATRTVTFFRYKSGHLLLPGRTLCGDRVLADIGIDRSIPAQVGANTFANDPRLWGGRFPWPSTDGHKYSRGHVLALSGGPTTSGAGRLSARAALRVGAGLVTLGSPVDALGVNGAHLTAVMLKACGDAAGLRTVLADKRFNAVVLGPGLGVGAGARALVEAALHAEAGDPVPRSVVLDADALASFAGDADQLGALIRAAPGPVVVTPHEGEYGRLMGDTGEPRGSRLDRARRGASALGAIMLLKGADTVVAEPGGRASIAGADAPWLATAGSGDVLSGLIGGLLAQSMPAFEAASAAAHLHAAVARRFGPGLIAEDIPEGIPAALRALDAAPNGPGPETAVRRPRDFRRSGMEQP